MEWQWLHDLENNSTYTYMLAQGLDNSDIYMFLAQSSIIIKTYLSR